MCVCVSYLGHKLFNLNKFVWLNVPISVYLNSNRVVETLYIDSYAELIHVVLFLYLNHSDKSLEFTDYSNNHFELVFNYNYIMCVVQYIDNMYQCRCVHTLCHSPIASCPIVNWKLPIVQFSIFRIVKLSTANCPIV